MAAHDDFDAFKMTLKALVDGGGAGYAFRRGLRYTIDGCRELMLTSPEQYYAFLQAVAKMATKLEGDCPGIAVWPLATGPYLPGKVKNIRISPQSMLSCSRQKGLQKWEQ